MVNTLNGLEKAVGEMKLRSQKMADQFEALSSTLDDFIWEIRASFASPLLTLPKFDGSRALVWLARANQYFLITKTPSDRRVDVAIEAMSGPATTWLKLLLMRCPSLSWDKFTQELLRRFGDTSPPESRVQHDFHTPGTQPLAHVNITKSHNLNTKPTPRLHPTPAQESAHIKAELIGQRQHDAKTLAPDSQPKYSPSFWADPVLEPAPLLHSSPPPQPQPQFATTPKLLSAPMQPPLPQHQVFPAQSSLDVPHPTPRKLPLPLAIQKPIPPPVLVPLPYPTTLPTPATATAPLMSASPDILQFQPSISPLFRRFDPAAAAEATLMYLFLLVHGHIPWFSFSPHARRHEWEPPPNKVIGFNLELNLEGKVVSRVRQLIRIRVERIQEVGENTLAVSF